MNDALRKFLALVVWLCVTVCVHAAPVDAVVRLTSHGGSGCVVYVGNGKSLILTCAHCFEGRDRTKPIVLDAPSPNPGAAQRPGVKLLKVDYATDLALVEVAAELPYCTPIAPAGYRPSQSVLSCGYDRMGWPAVQARATLIGSDGPRQYSRENPVPGRSGGPLIDMQGGVVLGTCTGYESGGGWGRGIYSSHAAVLKFIGWQQSPASPQGTGLQPQRYGEAAPAVGEERQWGAGYSPQQPSRPPTQPYFRPPSPAPYPMYQSPLRNGPACPT